MMTLKYLKHYWTQVGKNLATAFYVNEHSEELIECLTKTPIRGRAFYALDLYSCVMGISLTKEQHECLHYIMFPNADIDTVSKMLIQLISENLDFREYVSSTLNIASADQSPLQAIKQALNDAVEDLYKSVVTDVKATPYSVYACSKGYLIFTCNSAVAFNFHKENCEVISIA